MGIIVKEKLVKIFYRIWKKEEIPPKIADSLNNATVLKRRQKTTTIKEV